MATRVDASFAASRASLASASLSWTDNLSLSVIKAPYAACRSLATS